MSDKAVRYCLYLLSRKNYTTRQLRDKLRRKDYTQESIREALAKLDSWHYLDDANFTELYVRDRVRLKPRGQHMLLQELKAKGISREMAKEKIDKVMLEEKLDDQGLAELALQRKMAGYRKVDAEKGSQRARRYLLRQGFSYEIADKIVRKYWKMKTS
ncbi:MAG: regulatory protein RecX [bacterium]|nr:regulatory protein RecX [bacterium]